MRLGPVAPSTMPSAREFSTKAVSSPSRPGARRAPSRKPATIPRAARRNASWSRGLARTSRVGANGCAAVDPGCSSSADTSSATSGASTTPLRQSAVATSTRGSCVRPTRGVRSRVTARCPTVAAISLARRSPICSSLPLPRTSSTISSRRGAAPGSGCVDIRFVAPRYMVEGPRGTRCSPQANARLGVRRHCVRAASVRTTSDTPRPLKIGATSWQVGVGEQATGLDAGSDDDLVDGDRRAGGARDPDAVRTRFDALHPLRGDGDVRERPDRRAQRRQQHSRVDAGLAGQVDGVGDARVRIAVEARHVPRYEVLSHRTGRARRCPDRREPVDVVSAGGAHDVDAVVQRHRVPARLPEPRQPLVPPAATGGTQAGVAVPPERVVVGDDLAVHGEHRAGGSGAGTLGPGVDEPVHAVPAAPERPGDGRADDAAADHRDGGWCPIGHACSRSCSSSSTYASPQVQRSSAASVRPHRHTQPMRRAGLPATSANGGPRGGRRRRRRSSPIHQRAHRVAAGRRHRPSHHVVPPRAATASRPDRAGPRRGSSPRLGPPSGRPSGR